MAEQVSMVVSETSFILEADYQFVCRGGATDLVIRYPFPADTTLGEPRLLHATVRTSEGRQEPLEIVAGDDGWRWILTPKSGSNLSVQIAYHQEIKGRRATYVLTSAREWKYPLSVAKFEVRLPPGVGWTISPPMSLSKEDGDAHVYRAEFRDWTPSADLVVTLK